MPPDSLNVADLSVDLERRVVARDGAELDVRGLTFSLFAALIERRGNCATLQDLVDDVWGGEAVTNEVVTQRVRLLRRALGDDPAQPRYIETVRQKGYRLCAPVAFEPRSAPVPPASATQAPSRWSRLGIAMVLCAGGLFVLFNWPGDAPVSDDPILERARAYAATGQGDDNLRAIDLFEQKLASSPGHYGASLGLSFAYSQRVCRHNRNPEFVARARALAQALLEKWSSDPEAVSALAYAEDCAGNLEGALAGYLRAYELDNTQLDALSSASHLLQVKGELATALANSLFVESDDRGRELRYVDIQIARCLELMTFDAAAAARYARTVTLHPDNLFAATAYVRFLMSRGRLEEAVAAATRSARLGAASADLWVLRAELAFLQDRPQEVQRALMFAGPATQTSDWPETARTILLADAPDVAMLRKRVHELEQQASGADTWPITALHLAVLHAHLGDEATALAALATAIDRGYRDAAYLEVSPVLAGLRELSGFEAQLRRMRMAASAQRDQALAASWWSPTLIDPDAL